MSQAINRAPNLCQARFNRAFSYQALDRTELALQDLKEVITLCGDVATGAYYHAAQIMIELGDVPGGCSYLRTTIREAGSSELGQRATTLAKEACP